MKRIEQRLGNGVGTPIDGIKKDCQKSHQWTLDRLFLNESINNTRRTIEETVEGSNEEKKSNSRETVELSRKPMLLATQG
jgi:hypothetical protein